MSRPGAITNVNWLRYACCCCSNSLEVGGSCRQASRPRHRVRRRRGRAERHDGERQQRGADGDGRGEEKKTLSTCDGITSSLRKNLPPSASGWSKPPGPTRLGPTRSCIQAETFRSDEHQVRARAHARTPITATITMAVWVAS